ncbi:MAG: 2-dehydropantoate 2-reductase [Alphaproteobacteria bacterium]|nr:2-dehydropantoate 2-reductase [Alphaproteobacteria bacterium]
MSAPILIWGAGAIGGTVGAYLKRAGHDVAFVDVVPEHVAAIRGPGLKIVGPIAEFAVSAPAFLPAEVTGRFERIFLCVKAHHTADAARALLPRLAEDGYVLSLQNGLNELTIAEIVGARRTIGAFVNFGADYLEPGVITYGGRGACVLGEIDGTITPRLTALHTLMRDFDRDAIVTDNIWGYLWGKLGYGALLFVTALTNDSIADALAMPEHGRLYHALGCEVMAVAAAEKVRCEGFNGFDPGAFVPGADPARLKASMDTMVAHNRKSTKTHSGIWRDLAVRKRKTEIDAQIAIIGTVARRHAIATPIIDRLVELIHEIEDGKRPLDRANLAALARAMPAAAA